MVVLNEVEASAKGASSYLAATDQPKLVAHQPLDAHFLETCLFEKRNVFGAGLNATGECPLRKPSRLMKAGSSGPLLSSSSM